MSFSASPASPWPFISGPEVAPASRLGIVTTASWTSVQSTGLPRLGGRHVPSFGDSSPRAGGGEGCVTADGPRAILSIQAPEAPQGLDRSWFHFPLQAVEGPSARGLCHSSAPGRSTRLALPRGRGRPSLRTVNHRHSESCGRP